MIPGTIFMSLLAGALFGVIRGLFLVVFNATAGASSCYFLSKLIGRPVVTWLWPEKLNFFQAEVHYLPFSMGFLDVAPILFAMLDSPPVLIIVRLCALHVGQSQRVTWKPRGWG